MGTYVRITAPECERDGDDETNDEHEEEKMAFSCMLWIKEECDGCGLCEAQQTKGTDDEENGIAETEK